MKIRRVGVVGVSIAAALSVAMPGFAGGNKYAAEAAQRNCADSDVVKWLGPTMLWPPNHKYVPVSISAVGNDATENVSITVTPVVTDVAGGDGGPQHDPDYTPGGSPTASGTGSAKVDLSLRAERSGRGTGRTYTINWTATFDNGSETCKSSDAGQSPFVVSVPHDMRDKKN